MHKKILVPTDGSDLSDIAIDEAADLAGQLDAEIVLFHVIPNFRVFTYDTDMLEDTRERYLKDSDQLARRILSRAETRAKDRGISCQSAIIRNDHPYEAIIEAAKENGCDLIVMASHGRKGVKGLFLGSETQAVLNHSSIPVMVCRQ